MTLEYSQQPARISCVSVFAEGSVQSLFNFAYHTKLTRYKYTRNKIGRKTEIKKVANKNMEQISSREQHYTDQNGPAKHALASLALGY